jgi:hypothetical protein
MHMDTMMGIKVQAHGHDGRNKVQEYRHDDRNWQESSFRHMDIVAPIKVHVFLAKMPHDYQLLEWKLRDPCPFIWNCFTMGSCH